MEKELAMTRKSWAYVGIALSACIIGIGGIGVSSARAGNVFANTANGGLKEAAQDPNGDYSVGALSFQNAVNNNNVTGDTVLNGAKVNRAPNTPPGKVHAGFINPANQTSLFLKSELTKFNDHSNITSTTGQYSGTGSAFVDGVGNKKVKGTATNNKPAQNPQKGGALGTVIDPFTVASGPAQAYSPPVSGGLLIEAGESGQALFYGVDSYVFGGSIDNITADDLPLSKTLWSLTLSANSPTISPSTVTVTVTLSPLALNELTFPSSFLSTLTYTNTPTELSAIETSLEGTVMQALTQNGAEVDLPDGFTLFPSGTTYSAALTQVGFSDGVQAEITGVPEPTSGLILAGAACGWLLRRTRSRRRE
jgi:hypothetical protein